MVRFILILLLTSILFPKPSIAQFDRKSDSLLAIYKSATNDSDKVIACGKLAEYYYIFQLHTQGDSLLQLESRIAELSQNKNLVLIALFDKAVMNISIWSTEASFDKAIEFVQKGLDYAKGIGREDYVTLSYIRIAGLYRRRGQPDNAYSNANIAFTSSLNIDDDSIKILATIELGEAYQFKGESLLAFKTYTKAFDMAVDQNNIYLQSQVYHSFFELYRSLGNKPAAKENLLESHKLNKKNGNNEGLIWDNNDLARLTDEPDYIKRALIMAESLNLEKYIIDGKGLMWGYYTYIVGNTDSTLDYVKRNPDLKQSWMNTGMPIYYRNMGSIYQYGGKYDSAVYYLQLAQPAFEKEYNERSRLSLYSDIASCYTKLNKPQQAISYYERALALKGPIRTPGQAAQYSFSLSSLYAQLQDYKKAFDYSQKGVVLEDSMQTVSTNKDIASIEVNNERKRHEKELEVAAQHQLTRRNLQYMAITIFITGIFFILIVIGMFPISKITVKLLGYFAFISLFEFLVLLIEPLLHRLTDGEPLKIWLIKIVLIALLVPFQHYLEHGLIRFLHSRKKRKFSLTKWWHRPQKPSEATIDNIEKDTAIL
jgi:tetratricopeptide (TPR) repeat protein